MKIKYKYKYLFHINFMMKHFYSNDYISILCMALFGIHLTLNPIII